MLKTFGVTPVSDERIVHEGDIVTCAGVSAGIDLAMWLAGQISGEGRAKAVQLVIEYDPQPPFDSGHMSKASAATKATATAMLSKETVKHGQLAPSMLLLWDQALRAARSRRSPSVAISACLVALTATDARRNRSSSVVGVNLAYDDRGTRRPGAVHRRAWRRRPHLASASGARVPDGRLSRHHLRQPGDRRHRDRPTGSAPSRWSPTPPR